MSLETNERDLQTVYLVLYIGFFGIIYFLCSASKIVVELSGLHNVGQIWPGLPGPLMSFTPFLPPLKICSELHFSARNTSSTTIRLLVSAGPPSTTHQMTRGIFGAPPGAGPTPPRKRSNTAVREPEEDESAHKRLKNIWKSEKQPETLEEALEEIAFLKSHLKTALEYIDKTKTAIGKCSLQ